MTAVPVLETPAVKEPAAAKAAVATEAASCAGLRCLPALMAVTDLWADSEPQPLTKATEGETIWLWTLRDCESF